MEIASNPKVVVLAVVGLCAVIGVMSLLAAVYYTNAASVQFQMDTEIALLTAERNGLEAQVEDLDSQIAALEAYVSSLNTQIWSLTAQVSSLNAEKAALNEQVTDLTRENANLRLYIDGLTDMVETYSSRLSQYETPPAASGRGMGVRAYMK